MPENAESPPGGNRTSRTGPTDEFVAELVRLLRTGVHLDVAAEAAGCDPVTLDEWLRKGVSAPHGRFRRLREAIIQARAEGEARHVVVIASAARENWQAAAWLLERGYPARWARLSQRERAGAETGEFKVPTDDAFAEVDELARRRRGA